MLAISTIVLLFVSVHSATIQDYDDGIKLSENYDPDVISEVLDLLRDGGNVDKLIEVLFEDIQHHHAGCSCHHNECRCCREIIFFFVGLEVCVRLQQAGRFFVLQADVSRHVLYKKVFDENHFLKVCHHLHLGGFEVCAQIADIKIEPGHLSGCIYLVKPIKHKIACFKLRISSANAQKKFLVSSNRFKK